MTIATKFDPARNIMTLNGVPVSLHCHHYNCGLLQVIEKFPQINAHTIFISTAAEEFFNNFKNCLAGRPQDFTVADALQAASDLYRYMGFGRIDLSHLGENGGIAYSDSSYFVVGWLAKYGRRKIPVCYETCGFIAGILAAVFNFSPDTYAVKETECMVSGGKCCTFSVRRSGNGH